MNKRPREYAAAMLIELRKFWKAYQDEHVPEEFRPMVNDYVVNAMKIGRARKK